MSILETAKADLKQLTIEATVIRADGTREELGVINYWHSNPIKRIIWRIKQWLQSSLTQAKQSLQTALKVLVQNL